MLFKNFRVSMLCKNFDVVPFSSLYEQGYRLVMTDLDNTLAKHGMKAADSEVLGRIQKVKDIGFECVILSNALKSRVESFCQSANVNGSGSAHKPGTKVAEELIRTTQIPKEKAIFIGDQVMTDAICGKNLGVFTIIVDPYCKKEPWRIRFKRPLERWFKKRMQVMYYAQEGQLRKSS